MTSFPDICDWYTPERIAAEEPLWATGPYKDNARRILDVCHRYNLHNVLEAGCGTGWIPTMLPANIHYMGLDNNPHMLERARSKNYSRIFFQRDLRQLTPEFMTIELVCSFAVLKHFSLQEWPVILANILSVGNYTLFTQHILQDGRPAMDVGTEFHHVWPKEQELLDVITSCGHEVLDMDYSAMDYGIGAPEAYVTTSRRHA